MGHWGCGPYTQICDGTGRTRARCRHGFYQRRGSPVEASDPLHSDRVRGRRGRGWRRLCREPGAARGQCHWLHRPGSCPEREIARAAQRDRASCDAGGSPSRFCLGSRTRPVRRSAGRGAASWHGVAAYRYARAGEIERDIGAFAGSPNSGLIVTGSPFATIHRDLIIKLAARHRLPAVYYERSFVTDGGLISYGPDYLDDCRRAAGYVDRILKGEKPADLPVQAPTKYHLIVNLKTAKALGIAVPPSLLARADEVIE